MIIANRLKELRIENGFSKAQLASKIGVSEDTIESWELGKEAPNTDELVKLSKVYGLTIDEVLFGKKEVKRVEAERINVNGNKESEVFNEAGEEVHQKAQETYTRFTNRAFFFAAWQNFVLFAILLAYLLLGFLLPNNTGWGLWWPLWLLLPVFAYIPIVCKKKLWSVFPYTFLVAFIYFFVCQTLQTNIWHPLWVIFLTIPLYHAFARFMDIKSGRQQ